MIFSIELISVLGLWVSQIFYVLCYIPQLRFNYKNKTGHGVSDLMLLGYFNGLVAFVYYLFLCDLPLAYKLTGPLQIAAVLVLIFQRLFYDKTQKANFYRILYTCNIASAFVFIPMALSNPHVIGKAAGWLMFALACVNQLPQVIKIYREKSASDFSILFAVFTFMAASIEFVAGLFSGVPVQTLVTALRGVVISIIWLVQFRIYRKH